MPNRRRFLQTVSTVSAVPLLGKSSNGASTRRDYFKELNIRPFINAAGTYTTLTASLMHPEVVAAIDYASRQFVHRRERRFAKISDYSRRFFAKRISVESERKSHLSDRR